MIDIMSDGSHFKFQKGDFLAVKGVEKVKQHIITALNTFYSDWHLDSDKGFDLANGLRNLSLLETDIRRQILEVENVISLRNFRLVLDDAELSVKVYAVVQTEFGVVEVTQSLRNQN